VSRGNTSATQAKPAVWSIFTSAARDGVIEWKVRPCVRLASAHEPQDWVVGRSTIVSTNQTLA